MPHNNHSPINDLDVALVACLRFFARRGRSLREQYSRQTSLCADTQVDGKEGTGTGTHTQKGGAR
jgi:hypothetical protein